MLSYLSRWKEVLQVAATHSTSLIVALYLPNDPIGFVKNRADLQEAIEGLAKITKWVQLNRCPFPGTTDGAAVVVVVVLV